MARRRPLSRRAIAQRRYAGIANEHLEREIVTQGRLRRAELAFDANDPRTTAELTQAARLALTGIAG